MPLVTPSWIDETKLRMMNAVAIGAPTAAAMVAVRAGSRTRLAMPRRVAALCRRKLRPAARSTIGAHEPRCARARALSHRWREDGGACPAEDPADQRQHTRLEHGATEDRSRPPAERADDRQVAWPVDHREADRVVHEHRGDGDGEDAE